MPMESRAVEIEIHVSSTNESAAHSTENEDTGDTLAELEKENDNQGVNIELNNNNSPHNTKPYQTRRTKEEEEEELRVSSSSSIIQNTIHFIAQVDIILFFLFFVYSGK
jgi:hypothetical protein